ncbi:hypothetical protein [Candidatus Nitrososphaera sp. FF02]|uniref:hypothetical protein n=1 Tax=Candidatus Nitrososphaera sp. FF02 TaxID=3398226 RepID=UPI0039ED427D
MRRKAVKHAAISAIVAAVLLAGLASQAHANQMDALLLPGNAGSKAHLTAYRDITLVYPEGSELARLLDGRVERLEFSLQGDSANPVVEAINRAILDDIESVFVLRNATVDYVAEIKGGPDEAVISYKIDIKSEVSGFLLQEEEEGEDGDRPAIVDIEWRSFSVKGPVVVETEHGAIDINRPASALGVMVPGLDAKLAGAGEIMEEPVLDFGRFGLPMTSWHFLFDVTGEQLKNYGVFLPGEGATVSIFSIGESSFREGTYLPRESEAEITVDGTRVEVHSKTPPPSGGITVAGYARAEETNDVEYLTVSSKQSGLPVLGFQLQVLMALGGMMGAIAVFVLFKSRR